MIPRTLASLALVSVIALSCSKGSAPPAPFDLQSSVTAYRQRQDDAGPEAVLAWLKAGNARFAAGTAEHGGFFLDVRERRQVSATGQRPLAVVLSCLDSRTSPEIVFDTSVGDLFVARVGANVLNDDILGSLEIAVESGVKAVVVLGHTDCGGIKAACNGLELGHFTQLLDRVKPALASANAQLDADPSLAQAIGERSATNRKYVAHVSRANALQTTRQIRERSALLREHFDKGEARLVPAVYDVDTGLVTFEMP